MSRIGDEGLGTMANKIGAGKDKTSEAPSRIRTTLLGSMTGNVQTADGASGFLIVIDKDHDGSIFNYLSGFIKNAEQGSGKGILKHTLGIQQPVVEQRLSAKAGPDSSQVSKLLQIACPILMGHLGKQKTRKQWRV